MSRGEPEAAIIARLEALEPVIKKICLNAGTPGVSLGVTYQGKVIYRFNHGYRDVEDRLPADSDTVYPIGTLAKALTASAVCILVNEGKLQWSTPIKDILPDFESRDEFITRHLNINDLLCHRGGLARSNHWWLGSDGVLLMEKQQTLSAFNNFPASGTFRSDWAYSNWGYAIVGEVIEKVTGMSFADYVSTRLFQPLKMLHTTARTPSKAENENVARPYAALDDGKLFALPDSPVQEDTIMVPAGGFLSSCNDLLAYSTALLQAAKNETMGTSSGPQPIIKNALNQLSGHVLVAKSVLEKSYAFGFYRTQLPNTLSGMGWNSIYVKKLPKLVPRNAAVGPVLAHSGSLPGYHTAMALLPAMEAGVVVCTNSIALGDASAWINTALLEALIDTPSPSDFDTLSAEAARRNVAAVPSLVEKLDAQRNNGPPTKELSQYVGQYQYHDQGIEWQIQVREKADGLEVLFQGLESQAWPLKYHGNDTFLWLADRETQAKRARMVTYPMIANVFKIIFQVDSQRVVTGLCWPHDPALPAEKQLFLKQT